MHDKPMPWVNKGENIQNNKVKIKFLRKKGNVSHPLKDVSVA